MAGRERMAGQRLMVGFVGTELNADLCHLIKNLKIGGIILFRRNLETPDQITRLCKDAQQYAHECGLAPLFIAVDQEGGCVSRLPQPYSQFEGNPSMRSKADARRFAEITGSELKTAGFNMNMAPVLDVAPTDGDSIMKDRAFGGDPHWVTQMGLLVIDGLREKRVVPVAKHFPGIGRTVLDSHRDLPRMAADYDSLSAYDLLPFRKAIQHRIEAVMLSHILYERLDPKWPASLSRRIASDLLRSKLGFDGVVITDDLDMGAIDDRFDIRTVIDRIMICDIDIALICHSIEKMEVAFEQILNSLSGSTHAAYERIMRLKKHYL
jgi:beta-N-acetylhexosaminidase